ncbi:MAG: carbohydrate ABC transporter permease [Erysipelotrichaceae bacterium]
MKRSYRGYILEFMTIALFLFFISPLILVLFNAAKTGAEISANPLAAPENWATLWENVKYIWTNKNVGYPRALFSSVIVTFFSLLSITFTSAMAAWVLARNKSKKSTFVFMIFVAAMVVPFQVVMFPLVQWFKILGEALGVRLLQNYLGLIFAYTGFGASLSIFMFHGFIKSIPTELEDAARIDGCGKIKTFLYIVFPILKPIYVTILILNGIWIWNDYLLPLLIVGKGTLNQTIPLAVSNFAGAFLKSWDLMMTAILMAIVPVVFFFVIAQKYIIKGMVDGAVK